jgi:hypothetical protein
VTKPAWPVWLVTWACWPVAAVVGWNARCCCRHRFGTSWETLWRLSYERRKTWNSGLLASGWRTTAAARKPFVEAESARSRLPFGKFLVSKLTIPSSTMFKVNRKKDTFWFPDDFSTLFTIKESYRGASRKLILLSLVLKLNLLDPWKTDRIMENRSVWLFVNSIYRKH